MALREATLGSTAVVTATATELGRADSGGRSTGVLALPTVVGSRGGGVER